MLLRGSLQVHPLLKSNEFYIPLNNKFAVHIFHDNKKRTYNIYRHKVPNGSSIEINSFIYKHSPRFIIGEKAGIEKFQSLEKTFKEISSDLKKRIDAYYQMLAIAEKHYQGKEETKILKQYLQKYEEEGTLSWGRGAKNVS